MELSKFNELIQNLFHYFDRKQPGHEQLRLWFSEITHIPNMVVDFIYQKITRDNEAMPKNIPMAIKAGWEEWKKLNPAKVMNYQVTDCKVCGSIGLMFYRKKEKPKSGIRYEYCACCPDCENWRRHFNEKPIAKDREELELNGYEVWPYVKAGVPAYSRENLTASLIRQEYLMFSDAEIPF